MVFEGLYATMKAIPSKMPAYPSRDDNMTSLPVHTETSGVY